MAVRINSGQRSAEEYFQLDSAAFSCVQLRSAAFSCQWRANLIWRWKISQKKKEKEFACGLLFWLLSCSLFPIWRKRPKTVLDMVSVHWLLVTSLNSYVAVGYLRHQYWYFNLITALLFSFFRSLHLQLPVFVGQRRQYRRCADVAVVNAAVANATAAAATAILRFISIIQLNSLSPSSSEQIH